MFAAATSTLPVQGFNRSCMRPINHALPLRTLSGLCGPRKCVSSFIPSRHTGTTALVYATTADRLLKAHNNYHAHKCFSHSLVPSSPDKPMYQYQASIPKLPVPSLQETSEKYLKSVRPHLSDSEYEQTQKVSARHLVISSAYPR